MRTFILLTALLVVASTQPLSAQKKSKSPAPATTTTAEPSRPTFNDTLFKSLKWRNIGPFRGGRSNTVSGVIQNDNLYYCGYTGGGIWKTEDAGLNWRNISDGFLKTSSVGDIAVAESDPNVIYVGMGEHAIRGVMTSCGDGVYKSVDGGQTWKHSGLENTRTISDVVIHPKDPEVVYVAAQGAPHGPSEDRGIYKTTDGGKSWKKILYVDANSGAASLSMDTKNPRVLYATTWQHRRLPWKVESGGPGSMVWKSVDGGETWQKIMEGLPAMLGKIGISVSRANPNRVYAIVEAEKSKAGVYRSDDGGKKWALMTADPTTSARSWYYMEIFADPKNADVVYVLNAPMLRSIDGGKTFTTIRVGHGDTHDLWINPNSPQNMILGDDGGGEITFNTGRSWSSLNNQPTAQFYRVNADNLFPYRVYGGQQDNSSVVIASRTNGPAITQQDWFTGPGCECAYIAFNPDDPSAMYGGCYQGQIEMLDEKTSMTKDIMQYPAINLGNAPKTMKYRFNWNAPIIASPHDPNTIYHAANVLFRTTNGGISWQIISPDLTRNDTTKQGISGGPITNEGAGGENYNTLNCVVESPREKGVIVTGSDCGLVHLTRDGGKKWDNITPPGLPECVIHSVEVSPHSNGTIYVCANRFKFNEFGSFTYKTTDYGTTWVRIAEKMTDDFIKVIREDKKTPGLLYAGAENGFYVSFNGGGTFNRLQLNLPVTPVTDIIQRDNDLVVSTAGRAFWILDDVSALQQSNGAFGDKKVQVYAPKNTIRFSAGASFGGDVEIPGVGKNPPNGVILDYYLKTKADTNKVTLKIMDASGEIVRKYTNIADKSFKTYPGGPAESPKLPAERGLNRFAWDFRGERMPDVQDIYLYGDYSGRKMAPGQYRARLVAENDSSEATFTVLPDSRLKVTAADFAEQQQVLDQIEKDIQDVQNSVNKMRRLRKQIDGHNELFKDRKPYEKILQSGKALVEKMNKWEENIVQTKMKSFQDVLNFPPRFNNELFDLRNRADEHDPRVTQGVRDRLRDLETQWAEYKKAFQSMVDQDVAGYNQLFTEVGAPAVVD